MCMYNPSSMKAEEFIDHQEILDTLAYSDEHKNDRELILQILEKSVKVFPTGTQACC